MNTQIDNDEQGCIKFSQQKSSGEHELNIDLSTEMKRNENS